MIEQYLKKRQKILINDLSKYKEEYEHNQIAIVEAKNKIAELENSEDAATKIFSVRTREKELYKTQEIRNLESRITIYVTENIQNRKLIASCENELNSINECIKEYEDVSRETSDVITQIKFDTSLAENKKKADNVSRETLSVEQLENIVNRLELCKNLVSMDINRVSMELDMLIKELKNK